MEAVALDIGPAAGALVIYPSERYAGCEIEISRPGGERRVHTGVHERRTARGPVLSAIFGRLPPGRYVIWRDSVTPGPTVDVPAAAVTEIPLS